MSRVGDTPRPVSETERHRKSGTVSLTGLGLVCVRDEVVRPSPEGDPPSKSYASRSGRSQVYPLETSPCSLVLRTDRCLSTTLQISANNH